MVRAAVMPGPGSPIEVREYPEPRLEPGGVLLKTLAAEVCGTDVHLWHGRLAGVPYPLIPGHVSVGEVEVAEGEVLDIEGQPVCPGQVVTFLDVHETCHACWYCLVAKASTRCPARKVYGITYGAEDGLLGGWSEKIVLKPGVKILPLPKGISPEEWIGGGCSMPTAVHAIELARVRLGDRVLVQGSGPVGLTAAILAQLSGAGWVGVLGGPEVRLEMASTFGADWTANVFETTPDERRRAILDATSRRGPDVVIEATGNPAAIQEGCELVRDAGRYVVVGQYTDHGEISLNPHLHLNRKHLEIIGCWGSDFSHFWRGMEIMRRFGKQVGWQRMITNRYSLDRAEAALEGVRTGRVVKAVIEAR